MWWVVGVVYGRCVGWWVVLQQYTGKTKNIGTEMKPNNWYIKMHVIDMAK